MSSRSHFHWCERGQFRRPIIVYNHINTGPAAHTAGRTRPAQDSNVAASNPIAMSPHDHAAQALTFLSQSKKEFEANDIFQGSEKLWGAACHALFAAVGQSGGRIPESHAAIRKRVEQLARDLDEPELSSGFAIAESFHKIFYHGMMEEHELEFDFPKVERLVNRLLALNGQQGNGQGTVR